MTQEVDVEAVRKRFREANMPGALKFLDFLLSEKGKKLPCIAGMVACQDGGARISLGASLRDPKATPLGDLVRFSLDLHKHPPEDLLYIDAFMAGYATSPMPGKIVEVVPTSIN